MKTIQELNEAIEAKQHEIDTFEIDESTKEDSYIDMLDECYEGVFNIYPSTILEKCDPIAYNMGLSEYVDSLEIEEEEEYKELLEELEELETELEELEETL